MAVAITSGAGLTQARRASIFSRALLSPAVIVVVALLLRLGNIFWHHRYDIWPAYAHLFFGYEVGRIASALASGQGFSSPFPAWSGPTAWVGPVYPLLLGGIFKIFGIYSTASAVVILILNSIFSALTCLAVYEIGNELFGRRVGLWSAWAWAILPYAIGWSAVIWETSLSTLLLSTLFWMTLRLVHSSTARTWAIYGLLWAVATLTSATALAFLPVATLWLWRARKKQQHASTHLLALSALLFVAAVLPWMARNYVAMGRPIFPRSNFGEELYMGNHEGSEGLCMFWDHPVWNKYEMQRFSELGELAYVAEKQRIALEWIRQNPGRFVVLTFKRIAFFWFDIPLQGSLVAHLGIGSRHAVYFGAALLSFWGLWHAIRRRMRGAFLFAGLFLFYPLVYYVTHSHPRYQHPITPEMLVISVFLLYSSAQEQPRFLRFGKRRTTATRRERLTEEASAMSPAGKN
jgi:4-amino-4-deoxy-L-arabinose transferase-like glycosyltransferase